MLWFTLITGIASVAGLIFSFLAWIRAGHASKAAREARDAITVRTLADEFQLACERMDQLLDFIHHDRFDEAALRAQELASALSEIPYRRASHLDEARRNELLNARTQFQEMHKTLAGSHQGLATDQKDRFVAICHEVVANLRKNLGIIKGEIDTGAKQ